ncbi:MAG: hypothetical protein AMJ78_08585 [Omnitrophica WOR_2 bacterium SM23_29]|nr:MAG: hypothetical protein AMJ78_08585 [Omnitrophica WOR_2 bacterium SM23_29]
MLKKIIAVYLVEILLCGSLFAAQIPTGQDAGSTVKEYTKEKQRESTFERLTTPKIGPPALDEEEAEELPYGAESVHINKIIVQRDVSIDDYVTEDELDSLVKDYENKTLSLQDMKELAKAITQEFADKGLKAYIPKQSFAGEVMYINLIPEKNNF